MRKLTLIGACLAALLGIGIATEPVSATSLSNDGTFDLVESRDTATLKMGHNLFVAGNNITGGNAVRGILFSAGNILQLSSQSEYAFIAGNSVTLTDAEVEKDLFVAGNQVKIDSSSKIGRDVFAAGNTVILNTNLEGDFSATAETVIIDNVKIDGDVNIDANKLRFTGDAVEIVGKLVINSDAEIITENNVKVSYSEIEKYENVEIEPDMASLVTAKSMSIVGLFVAFAIILAIFPRINRRVEKEVSGSQFIVDILVGFCTLVIIPFVSLLLIITFFAAPAGLLLLLAYIIMLFIAQGFTGLWLGKLIFEKALGWEINKFLEALVGIIVIGFASLIPIIGSWISFFALILGLGLIVQSMRRKRVEKHFYTGPTDLDDEEGDVKPKTKKSIKATPKARKAKTVSRKSKTVKEED